MNSKPFNNEISPLILPESPIFDKIKSLSKTSFIYRNINYYRFVMSLLYSGKYYQRFGTILKLISGKKVTELCFGDTIIAEYWRKKSIEWKGIDINEIFVTNALKKGLSAEQTDILRIAKLPSADTCIICGSLYHFNANLESLFTKMLECAPLIIISEPVLNLSNNKGIIGKLAKASARVNGKHQPFRFTEDTLLAALNNLKEKLKFEYTIVDRFEKDLIIVIRK